MATKKETETTVETEVKATAKKAAPKAESIADKAEKAVKTAKKKAEKLGDKLEDLADKIEDKAEEIADKIEDKVEAFADKAEDKAEEIADKISDKVEQITDKLEDKAEQAADKAEKAVKAAAKKAAPKAEAAKEKVVAEAEKAVEQVEKTAKKAEKAVKAAVAKPAADKGGKKGAKGGKQEAKAFTETPRLKVKYAQEVMPALKEKFGYKNVMEIPKLEKVILSMGLGAEKDNPKGIEAAAKELEIIAGQKPIITKAKKSVANFKVRQGMNIGAKVTLRGNRMYYFADKLMNIVLPRVRDFRGVSDKSFDGRGNYAMGVKEQLIFPEINYDDVDKVRGMNIVFVTSAKTDEEAKELLTLLGMPYVQD